MFDMAKEYVNLLICPLGGPYTEVRRYKIERAFEQLPDKYAKIIYVYIARKIDAYHTPNEDGYSAYDMDQAILRGA
jgi:hypothetical protein